jgi:hypothetical protein
VPGGLVAEVAQDHRKKSPAVWARDDALRFVVAPPPVIRNGSSAKVDDQHVAPLRYPLMNDRALDRLEQQREHRLRQLTDRADVPRSHEEVRHVAVDADA